MWFPFTATGEPLYRLPGQTLPGNRGTDRPQRNRLRLRRLVHGHDDRRGRLLARALVGARRRGVEVARIARPQRACLVAVVKLQLPLQYIQELEPLVHVRLGLRSEEHTSELQSRQYLVCR